MTKQNLILVYAGYFQAEIPLIDRDGYRLRYSNRSLNIVVSAGITALNVKLSLTESIYATAIGAVRGCAGGGVKHRLVIK